MLVKVVEPGEAVKLRMELKNTGTGPLRFTFGGQQRGPRNNQFRFIAQASYSGGKPVPDTGDSTHLVMVGPNFVNKYFPDAVYTVGPDGGLKLYGRVSPDLLHDPKPRKKP